MIPGLIERLEKAESGSRELDALIWAEVHPERIKVTGWNKPYGDQMDRTQVEFSTPPKRTRCVTSDQGPFSHAEPVTTSLDAALALASRVLPGWLWSAGTSDDGTAIAVLDDLNASGGFAESRAKTPALALCIAILKARAIQEQG